MPEEGIIRIREGLATWHAAGAELWHFYFLAGSAGRQGKGGRPTEGLKAIEEALTFVQRTAERFYEAEPYQLRGALLLQHSHNAQAVKT